MREESERKCSPPPPQGRNLGSTGPEAEAEQLLVETKEARMTAEERGRGAEGWVGCRDSVEIVRSSL